MDVYNEYKKKLLQNFCIAYRGILSKHQLYATGTSGRLIEEATNLDVHKLHAGHVGGEQQMAAVARALSGDTRDLLLDEPFEGLAPAVVEQLFHSFDKLREHLSIVIVDHNLDLALALSDRTVALEMGRVFHDGPSRALATDLDLRRQVLWL